MSLNPTYWGSLTTILVVAVLTVAFFDGAPVHAARELGVADIEERFFLYILVLVCFAIRSYLEVSQSTSGASPKYLMRLPEVFFRGTAFFLNVSIIIVSNLSIGVAVGYSLSLAIILCMVLQVFSLILSFVWFCAKSFDKSEMYIEVRNDGVFYNLLSFSIAIWLFLFLRTGSVGYVIVSLAIVLTLFAFEVRERFWSNFKTDLRSVRVDLVTPLTSKAAQDE